MAIFPISHRSTARRHTPESSREFFVYSSHCFTTCRNVEVKLFLRGSGWGGRKDKPKKLNSVVKPFPCHRRFSVSFCAWIKKKTRRKTLGYVWQKSNFSSLSDRASCRCVCETKRVYLKWKYQIFVDDNEVVFISIVSECGRNGVGVWGVKSTAKSRRLKSSSLLFYILFYFETNVLGFKLEIPFLSPLFFFHCSAVFCSFYISVVVVYVSFIALFFSFFHLSPSRSFSFNFFPSSLAGGKTSVSHQHQQHKWSEGRRKSEKNSQLGCGKDGKGNGKFIWTTIDNENNDESVGGCLTFRREWEYEWAWGGSIDVCGCSLFHSHHPNFLALIREINESKQQGKCAEKFKW